MHHTTEAAFDTGQREFSSEFARDVFIGLTSSPKWLSSKYFYNSIGDRIFQQIMKMPSYYLTNCEFEIFTNRADDILKTIGDEQPFRIIELGAGDGYKTSLLLEHFLKKGVDFTYAPCDISLNVLKILEKKLLGRMPTLQIQLLHGDYFNMLSEILNKNDGVKNIVFLLGANIGNFTFDRGIQFLQRVRSQLCEGDNMMIGFDLKKDPSVILGAYNDPEGITASFNLNLLHRINEELGADFDTDKFIHQPYYDPETGECRSYLVSKQQQQVKIDDIDSGIHIAASESIFMEISKKYSLEEIADLAVKSQFSTKATLMDQRGYFAEVIWEAI